MEFTCLPSWTFFICKTVQIQYLFEDSNSRYQVYKYGSLLGMKKVLMDRDVSHSSLGQSHEIRIAPFPNIFGQQSFAN